MKHAPGPWTPEIYSGVNAVCIEDDAGNEIGKMHYFHDGECAEKQKGNGILAAAAPGLLEQLEYCVEILQCHMPPGKRSIWPGCPESGWLDDYLDAPKAAIAKAKGEAK